MPDEDNNFGGSLVSDFRKWWRHVQPKNWFVVFILVTSCENRQFSTSAGGDLSNDTQTREIGQIEPEICSKSLRNLSK